MNKNLLRHYDQKYVEERNHGSYEMEIQLRAFPRTRFEAAANFFCRQFRGGQILELAAGDGALASTILKSEVPITSYIATEFSDSRLTGLRASLSDPRVRVAQLDAENIPEEFSNRFDAVIMIALIEHLIDPLRAMRQICETLKPGGLVFIDTPNIALFSRRLKLLLGQFPSTASSNEGLTTYDGQKIDLYDEGHMHYFTFRSLSLMLTQYCGFERVEMYPYFQERPFFPQPLFHILSRVWPQMFSELVIVAYRAR